VIRRHLEPELLAALRRSPAVFLSGARQTGKSTLAKAVAAGRHPARYLTLDDATTLAAARADPAGFVAGLDGPVVVDEVQREPDLFVAIKAAVDRDRRPGRFLLTGSASVTALPQLAEALVGRVEILTLRPFSQGELDGRRDAFVDALFQRRLTVPEGGPAGRGGSVEQRLLNGGFPEVATRRNATARRAWFSSYVATILQREVRELAAIEGLAALPQLLGLLAARATALLNTSELSRSAGLPNTTLKRYLALLQATFLVEPLPAWSPNLSKRLVRAPKLMFLDTGLLAHLLGVDARRLAADHVLLGPLLENFVATELAKQTSWSRVRPTLHHFRTHSGEEVDLVMEDRGGRVVGVEVKSAASVGARDFRGLRMLAEALGRKFVRGVVLYRGDHVVPFGKRLHALPVTWLWTAHAGPGG
jgi:predicted AAA+ superfamily ATPase